MSRSYAPNTLKKNRVYSIQDLMEKYSVSINTITNWTKQGLPKCDNYQPHLFRGAVVKAFHQQRRMRSKKRLRPGEVKCTGCKLAVFFDVENIEIRSVGTGIPMCFGLCPECGAHVQKIISQADKDYFNTPRNHNITVNCPHEAIQQYLGGIGKDNKFCFSGVWTLNDRLIYSWQKYAGRYDEKTVDRHLSAIRFLEKTLGGKPFEQLKVNDIDLVREKLKNSLTAEGELKKSKSTVAHTASHITAFLEWLIKQDGYRRLPRDLPDYLKLPKSVYSASLVSKKREYPTLNEAEAMLQDMPSRTIMEHRSKAIFAMAFLSGLRADTLASLRICHFDSENRLIIQDALTVRTKNGKSLNINWFPIPEVFNKTINEWVGRLSDRGFADFDALFPSNKILTNKKVSDYEHRNAIDPTSTKYVVTEAFKIASRNNEVKYTPHSARHTLAAERDVRPLTREQRKAWSEAMGHNNEQTTEVHYGKLSDERRAELFRQIEKGQTNSFTELSDEVKINLVNKVIEALKD